MWTNSTVKNLFGKENEEVSDKQFDQRRDTMYLKGAAGGATEILVGNLDPATIMPLLDWMLREVEDDYPEITMYDKLRDQNIVTSPGAKLLMGDVEKRVRRAATRYDRGLVRLFKMALAMAGENVKAGFWQAVPGFATSDTISLFQGFGFDSLGEGTLEMEILPRPLIRATKREEADELQVRAQAAASLSTFMPLEYVYQVAGVPEEDIPALVKKQQAKIEADRKAEAAATKQQQSPKPAPSRTGN